MVVALRKLSTYRKKRDFEKTDEPSARSRSPRRKRRRFVIQKHAATRLHYDLRLEFDGVFKSWAVTRGPRLIRMTSASPWRWRDHPLDYGDFEGTIPEGEYAAAPCSSGIAAIGSPTIRKPGSQEGRPEFTLDWDNARCWCVASVGSAIGKRTQLMQFDRLAS